MGTSHARVHTDQVADDATGTAGNTGNASEAGSQRTGSTARAGQAGPNYAAHAQPAVPWRRQEGQGQGAHATDAEQGREVTMPFKSARQRKFMHAKHPEIADRWEDEAKRKGQNAVQPGAKKRKKARKP